MSRSRVQQISVSLDGFATGEGQSLDAPFGHAGERLHEWMFVTLDEAGYGAVQSRASPPRSPIRRRDAGR